MHNLIAKQDSLKGFGRIQTVIPKYVRISIVLKKKLLHAILTQGGICMKKFIALLLCLTLLGLTACEIDPNPDASNGGQTDNSNGGQFGNSNGGEAEKPTGSQTENPGTDQTEKPNDGQDDKPNENPWDEADFVFDLKELGAFYEVFETKPQEQWEAMNQYTILLNGLQTPIYVQMNGLEVVSVSAYDQTAEINSTLYQGEIAVEIQMAMGFVVINDSTDYEGTTWLLNKGKMFVFRPQDSVSTQIFANEDGRLHYTTYWGEYMTSFNQWDNAPLDLCESREHFLYERGFVRISGDEVTFDPTEKATVSDLYDLDAMFDQAKKDGYYTQYQSVDELLAANAAR